MNLKITAAAAVAALAVAVPASASARTTAAASAAPAAHGSGLRVAVTWRHGHATEVVHVRADPHHVRVVAAGTCDSTGFAGITGASVRDAGAVSRVRCPKGFWESVGYITGRYPHAVYHAVLGNKNLYG